MPSLATPAGAAPAAQPAAQPVTMPDTPAGEDAPRADAAPPSSAATTGPLSATVPARLTAHARRRSTRRNLRPAEIAYVIAHGRPLQRTGVTFYFLARRDVPRRDLRWAARLVGTTVVVARNGEIITAYRNRAGLPSIRRKLKYRTVPEPAARAETLAELAGQEARPTP